MPGKVAGQRPQGKEHSEVSMKSQDDLSKGREISFSSKADIWKELQQTSGGSRTISSRDLKSRQGTMENPGSSG